MRTRMELQRHNTDLYEELPPARVSHWWSRQAAFPGTSCPAALVHVDPVPAIRFSAPPYYHIFCPEEPSPRTIEFLNKVLAQAPRLEINWIVLKPKKGL